jgi:hypothetical protein
LNSDAVNALSHSAEVFYRRLMSVADDFGRFDGRVNVIRASLYVLQFDRVTESDIKTWIKECEDQRLIVMYVVDNKPFIEIQKFNQQKRAKHSKWPDPPQMRSTCAADAQQTHSTCAASAHLDEGEGEGVFDVEDEGDDEGEGEVDVLPPVSGERKKSSPPPVVTRTQNPIFNAVRDIFFGGKVTKSTAKEIGKLASEFKDRDATPELIRDYRERYRRKWPTMSLTAHALVKHWYTLASEESAPVTASKPIDDFPAKPAWEMCAMRLSLKTHKTGVIDALKQAYVHLHGDKGCAPRIEWGTSINDKPTWPERIVEAERIRDLGHLRQPYVEYLRCVAEAVRLSDG